jgi:hypothetical protein
MAIGAGIAASLFFLIGCASTGEFKGQATAARVDLSKKNYKVIKVGAKGESSGFRFLGVIPFASPTYAQAKETLYDSIGIPLEGKAVALVNQTEDRSSIYLILFSIPKITITADVIEYLDEPARSNEIMKEAQ